ncbi:MAG: YIP1 family protein [Acidobacteria bacterium]|nr:YIP1 family protein [Acidobacteriota bacterium]MBI3656686.1 YIP1 family protein [Acidobacteriota bacterium]
METNASPLPSHEGSMGFLSRLLAVYFEPGKAYADLSRKPNWLGMAILLAALALTLVSVSTLRMDPETYMRKALEQNPMSKKLSEEQKRLAIEQSVNNPGRRLIGVIITPVAVVVTYLALAGIFLLLFVISGGIITFKQSLAATVWGMGPPGIIYTLLAGIISVMKDSSDLDLDYRNNLITSLNIVINQKDHPLLHSLLGSMDVFSFWTIFLLAMAFSHMMSSKISTGKAAVGITLLWAIYVAGKVGMSAIFS